MPGWNVDNAAGSAGAGAITLLEGSSFCISASNGDMLAGKPHGAFFHDTRFVSAWNLTVNGAPVEALAAKAPEPYRAVFIGRAARRDGHADSPLLIERDRVLGTLLTETITVHNHSRTPLECELALSVDADFADLFEVKNGGQTPQGEQCRRVEGENLVLESAWGGHLCRVVLASREASIDGGRFLFRPTIPPHGRWAGSISAVPLLDGRAPTSASSGEEGGADRDPGYRLLSWRTSMPIADLNNDAVQKVIVRSQEDLGALRMFDEDHPDRTVVAAGAPWFMALFGRDSLIASFMSLLLDPSLALGTLKTLADHQGKAVNPLTEEEPGRILHEVRLGAGAGMAFGGHGIYYGTADATPLFVAVLGELSRWGLEADAVRSLLPAADRALSWIQHYGDRDGDGFVEYARHNDQGLRNQGWKDSWDGINFADGTLAEPPIALCEVQGYTYAAYMGRALIALTQGDRETAGLWADKAARLKEAFNDRFWLPDRGYFALGLDRDKKPIDALTSNIGHCLWSGIVDRDKAAQVAERLMSPEMFTGWGIRTLASTMGAYNPASYHNGSVWPHDSALAAAGLMRYGFVAEAQRIAYGIFEAADYFGGRLPELFCGLDRASYPEPIPYPASCSPQAWASAAPIQLIRTLMRFDPGLPWKDLWLAPVLPEGFGEFRVDNVPFAGDARLRIDIDRDAVRVSGLPGDVRLRLEARPQLIELLNLSGMGRPKTRS